ncbi:N-alpha-acetyltransferase 30 [Paragonimus westermani]|uniref:N-alpha-acetyltransferase 30 n=1 Tax=Paragonimus westermani TaxID=34504 RepID=A0A5J4NIY7_9TREM|nr:N-alpha-acetyltransferase 30 [Paragonimus westermani]
MTEHCEAILSSGLEDLNITDTPFDPTPQPILFIDHANNTEFRQYRDEEDLQRIIPLISKDLSEPYSIYTYRYFIYQWPKLCLLAFCKGECVGTIVCKLEPYATNLLRGYIAMLVVKDGHRRKGIGSRLVQLAVDLMIENKCDEVSCSCELSGWPYDYPFIMKLHTIFAVINLYAFSMPFSQRNAPAILTHGRAVFMWSHN